MTHATWIAAGAHVRVIAPSSPFDAEAFTRGIERLRTRYRVSFDERIFARSGYLAGDDARRLAELRAAISDKGVDAIIAARGGYGATRLLPMLDRDTLRAHPKLLVGFSDVTALHALWSGAELVSLHGPMAATLGTLPEPLALRFLEALEGRGPNSVVGTSAITAGRASGILRGGNLSVLAALLGTPCFPRLEGAVLFLEDTGERPYRIDRMLTSLRSAGGLDRVQAIALGAFTKADAGPDGVTVDDVLRERLGSLGVPVLAGVPSGHIDDNLELPFGTEVTVDTAAIELRFDVRADASG